MTDILIPLLSLIGGGGLAWVFLRKPDPAEKIEEARREASAQADAAIREAETKAQSEIDALTRKLDQEVRSTKSEHQKREQRLQKREADLDERNESLSRKEKKVGRRENDISRRERKLTNQEARLAEVQKEHKERLEAIAGLSRQEARTLLLDEIRDTTRAESIDRVRAIEHEARELADERARMVISAAIQRYASEHVGDRTVSVVQLPSEDMKGRIIGREGRNIRAFESASGCDVVIDDAPDAILVSSFNPIRREIARISMEKLLSDGRIHPSRIEEVVAKTRKDMDHILKKYGEDAALELEVVGLHPQLIKALGRLHFTTSFAQNVLRHSMEVGLLAGMMAEELGIPRKHAVRAGLLHDIGKAIDHEAEGDTAEVGAAFCRKHGEAKAIYHAIAVSRDAARQNTILSQLVGAANLLSESRPGARRESLAAMIKRLEQLEELVCDFDGVEKCYAVQSGSEVRVMVDNARLSDRDADLLSREIARRIEREMSHIGEVRVTVVRSVRSVQYAR